MLGLSQGANFLFGWQMKLFKSMLWILSKNCLNELYLHVACKWHANCKELRLEVKVFTYHLFDFTYRFYSIYACNTSQRCNMILVLIVYVNERYVTLSVMLFHLEIWATRLVAMPLNHITLSTPMLAPIFHLEMLNLGFFSLWCEPKNSHLFGGIEKRIEPWN